MNEIIVALITGVVLTAYYHKAKAENCKGGITYDNIGSYTKAYRIPTYGTGTTATHALTNMFANTGGTFTGNPSINTTYYLDSSNTIV